MNVSKKLGAFTNLAETLMDLPPPPPPPHRSQMFGEGNGNVKRENEEDPGLRFPPITTKSKERRRKRIRRTKTADDAAAGNCETTENQRMTHIAVERNRRRLMNHHLTALRSLMPSSYVQRGDQASIIGGAIDFVKELEQLLECLEAQKRSAVKTTGPAAASSSSCDTGVVKRDHLDLTAESKSPSADVQVTVIQNHANLKIQCIRRPSQLLNAIIAFENLKLTVLHLNVASVDHSLVHYSFSLKVEEDCKIGRSAAEIAAAVHQIFSFIADHQLPSLT